MLEYNKKYKRKPIPPKIRIKVFKRDGYRCRICGRTNKDIELEIDHIIPVALGGTNDIGNLQTLCRECNRGKGANPPDFIEACEKQIESEEKRINELENKLKNETDEDEIIEIEYEIKISKERIESLKQSIEEYKIYIKKRRLFKQLYILDDKILSEIFESLEVHTHWWGNMEKEDKINILLNNNSLDLIEDLINKFKLKSYLLNLNSTIFNILTEDFAHYTKEEKIKIIIEIYNIKEIKKEVKKINNEIKMIDNLSEIHFNLLCKKLNVNVLSNLSKSENLLKSNSMNTIKREISNIERNDDCVKSLMKIPSELINELSLRFDVPYNFYTEEDKCFYIANTYSKNEIKNKIILINKENKCKEYLKSQPNETINKILLRLQIPNCFHSKENIIKYLFEEFSLDEIEYEINFNREEKLRLIEKYSALDDEIINKLNDYFPELSQHNNKKNKITYLVENYSYIIIDEKIKEIKEKLRLIEKYSALDDDIINKLNDYFPELSQHNNKKNKITYLVENYSENIIDEKIKRIKEKKHYYPIFYNIDENVLSIIFEELNVPSELNSKKEKLNYLFYEYSVNNICGIIDIINKNKHPTYCPKCLTKLRKDENFCPNCSCKIISSDNVEEKKLKGYYCPSCLNKVRKDDKFCPYCRYNLNPSIADKIIRSLKDSWGL